MAKRRKFYYVAVMSIKTDDNTIKFVDEIDYDTKWAHWSTWEEIRKTGSKAYKFTSLASAEQIAQALFFNGHLTMVVEPFVEIK